MITRRNDPDTLEAFGTDESGLYTACDLEAVLFPQSSAEVAEVLAEANARHLPVTISGGGTGITGGRVATAGGWELATEDLRCAESTGGETLECEQYGKRFTIQLDAERQEAWVPAGLSLEVLAKLLPAGLFYPPDPTEQTCLLGGTLATNASGARSFHYGATRAWVLGLTVILPNGDRLEVERGQVTAQDGKLTFTGASGQTYVVPLPGYASPALKNASAVFSRPDMDLADLFIGAEGLLGVITEAHLKLVPAPEELIGEIAFFATEAQALDFADTMRAAAQAGALTLLSLEYFDSRSLRFMKHEVLEGKDFGGAVYLELAGDLEALDPLMEALEAHGMVEDWFADTKADLHEQKAFRHSLPEGVNSYLRQQGSQKMGTDFVAPAENFRELLAAYHAAGQRFAAAFPREGEHYLMFGHLGDYHLHVNFLSHNADEMALVSELYAELAKTAIVLGGVVSGEHGVGKKTVLVDGVKVPYLQLMIGREGLLDLARLKASLDPNLILNLGNMVPLELYGEV